MQNHSGGTKIQTSSDNGVLNHSPAKWSLPSPTALWVGGYCPVLMMRKQVQDVWGSWQRMGHLHLFSIPIISSLHSVPVHKFHQYWNSGGCFPNLVHPYGWSPGFPMPVALPPGPSGLLVLSKCWSGTWDSAGTAQLRRHPAWSSWDTWELSGMTLMDSKIMYSQVTWWNIQEVLTKPHWWG